MKDIHVSRLSKSYGSHQVLRDFSAVFPAGKTSCIMGESGCGKTTLLHILMGLVPPDGGSVENMPQSIGAVFQEDRLCEELSVGKNIRLTCRWRLPDSTIRSHLAETLLGDILHQPVRDLSGGMKRRVAILRAVLSDREILILDEPFKGLDEATRAATAAYLKKHTAGKTLILVTHDPAEVALMGGSLLKMENQTF